MSLYQISNFIDGKLQKGSGAEMVTLNPATNKVLASGNESTASDVDAAVKAARKGLALWKATPAAERARVLFRAAQILRERNDELALLETRDTGRAIQETEIVDVVSAVECLEYFAGVAGNISGEHIDLAGNFAYTRREPVGVCAAIGAWNYPIQIASWKAAPALACGNAVVYKPSEVTPLSAIAVAQALQEAGLPDGVYNVVQGARECGASLVEHPGVDKVSLTGSAETGAKVASVAAGGMKAVTMELGGKSPMIVFEDADLENAVSGAQMANFYSSGQICSNGTRVFVHESVKDAFLAKLVERSKDLVLGDPEKPETQVGPIVTKAQFDKVMSYIELGKKEGATVVLGGHAVTEGMPEGGLFVAPTVFADCSDDMTIVREEIFGPVMSVLTFKTEEEAIRRANATEYGLAAGVFTRDLSRGHRVVAELEAGTCWINTYNITPIEMPFGGVKKSGVGRENSRAAIEHYTRVKSVYVETGDVPPPY
ncbi:betaine-aldehyde dehydrogenase [Thalassospira profundimaris]|uniref:Betaine-aldehyde dehydrogenase n=1 Tax=Thalassospira profundimaris TaxID=502049 RepID=A0A367XFL9_9PROT|nr:betaine-aldehyde dehydrogenase [Thalassospira profundimaris]RCK52458.1 betaine-aldehyde dehydrogenase [Thalassospira profundimaris]